MKHFIKKVARQVFKIEMMKVSSFQSLLQENRNTIVGLESRLQENRNTIVGLESRLQENRNTTVSLESRLQENRNTIVGLESRLQENRNTTVSLESKLSGIEQGNAGEWRTFFDHSIYEWQLFNKKHTYNELQEILKIMTKGMDKTSIETVDVYMKRCQLIFPIDQYKIFRMKIDQIFNNTLTTWEKQKLSEQNRRSYDLDIENKLCYENNGHFLMESCRFHNGLTEILGAKQRVKGTIAIDVGAFIGDSAYYFSKNYPFDKVYSFESNDQNYKILCENVNQFQLNEMVFPFNLFIDENSGKKIQMDGEGGRARFITYTDEGISTTTIDQFMELRSNEKAGLIKVDVEGFEENVLKGAIKTIKNDKPLLSIAIYHNPDQFIKTREFISHIRDDYHFKIRHLNLTPFGMYCEYILLAY